MSTNSRFFQRWLPMLILAELVLVSAFVCPSNAAEEKQEAPKDAAAQPTAKRSVAIIVDCSYSMTAKTQMPGGNLVSRMDMIKDAVKDLVDKLADRGDDISIYFFGHRAGWQSDPAKPAEVLLQKRNFNPPPDNLKPYADVEQILTLGPLTPERKTKFEKSLATVRPWGESPLYLSIHEALAQFPADAPQPSIIVLTDGSNNVFRPATDKLVTKESLLKTIKGRPVPIQIMGFQITPAERDAIKQDFREIGMESGGEYFRAESVAELMDQLSKAAREAGKKAR